MSKQDQKLTNVSDFAVRLRSLINERMDGTQAVLARRAKLTTAAVANYTNEQKGRVPKAEELYRIAKALGVTMEYLLTGEDSPAGASVLMEPPAASVPPAVRQLAAEAAEKIRALEAALKKI